jgi:hypothetical protein
MAFFWPVLALLFAGIHLLRHRHESRGAGEVPRVILLYWLGIGTGIASIMGAAFHVFDAQQVAQEICFTRGDGGFQFENAMGDLAIGVAGVLCLFIRDARFWLAVIVVMTIQFWGDAYGHIYQMIENDNHCPDNTGPVLWLDIAGPFIAIVLYLLWRRGSREPAPGA